METEKNKTGTKTKCKTTGKKKMLHQSARTVLPRGVN